MARAGSLLERPIFGQVISDGAERTEMHGHLQAQVTVANIPYTQPHIMANNNNIDGQKLPEGLALRSESSRSCFLHANFQGVETDEDLMVKFPLFFALWASLRLSVWPAAVSTRPLSLRPETYIHGDATTMEH
ncbi:uncharacterized protein PITG_15002 [Phytophthora infestans T30-4]|uniref:Uncharacterized protein n=1 Tax=Phytophthora infestans (strain T30-4) TaxID=403677 RepID=D0NRF6_PHYIT|nr:uncharacterized protein PITG_15002 [Phytophthora infestans T30-4]EEY63306.1 hypothetical protein PITG_15002 [Phytophthora infestans T30-4]|eukprot:XP_002898191.1 hypothetical protein PITG_15002 [Phytophthora infestans T30-4]